MSQRRGFSPIVRSAGAVVAGVLVVAGCGGASSSVVAPKPSAPTTTTTIESAETRLWVEAAATGVKKSPDWKVTASDAECLGRAFVNTLTVARLKAAGVTTSNLADPDSDLPPSLVASLPRPTIIALGAAMQACGAGLFATSLIQAVARDDGGGSQYEPDAASRACANRWFSSPDRQALIASTVLNSEPTKADAAQLADLIVTCLDVATLLAPSMHTTFNGAERQCIDRLAQASTGLRSALAAEMTGSGNGDATHAEEIFGVSIMTCLSPEHVLHIAETNN